MTHHRRAVLPARRQDEHDAAPCPERALATLPEFGPQHRIVLPAHHRYLAGDADGALRLISAGLIVARGAGDSLSEWFLTYVLCLSLGEQGRHQEVVDRSASLLDLIGDRDPVWRAKALSSLANGHASLGRTDQALDAVSDAEFLLDHHGLGTYNHMSSMHALTTAMRVLGIHEVASARLVALMRQYPEHATYAASESAQTHADWGAALELAGEPAQARLHYLKCLSSALFMAEHGSGAESAITRTLVPVYEAFVVERLGEPERARSILLPIPEDELRIDNALHDLAYLAAGRVSMHRGDMALAREHFTLVLETTERTGRTLWRSVALGALAELELACGGAQSACTWLQRDLATLHRRTVDEAAHRARELRERATVRELRDASDEINRTARIDPLTGLGNRRALDEWMADLDGERGAVFVDVDHFKQVNDTFSHEVGDQVLKVVAELLSTSVRVHDRVARYGGDEFVVICAGGGDGSLAVAERMHAGVRDHDWAALASGLKVTISVGVTPSIDGGDPLALADAALYRAKRGGRNQVSVAAG